MVLIFRQRRFAPKGWTNSFGIGGRIQRNTQRVQHGLEQPL
ncbi:MAG: hypothetical protein ACD_63C00017G0004, partial [uncultured bacterium]